MLLGISSGSKVFAYGTLVVLGGLRVRNLLEKQGILKRTSKNESIENASFLIHVPQPKPIV